jgi:transcriptional regulator of acetoin/glycerol metabolism
MPSSSDPLSGAESRAASRHLEPRLRLVEDAEVPADLEQRALAILRAGDEARFHDVREHERALGPVAERLGRGRAVWHFIQSGQRSLGRQVTQIADAAMDALVSDDWPGNVRELQNVIDRALILSPGPALRLEDALQVAPRHAARSAASPEAPRDAERAHIVGVLERCAWTIEGRGQAADRLRLRPSTLRNRKRKL